MFFQGRNCAIIVNPFEKSLLNFFKSAGWEADLISHEFRPIATIICNFGELRFLIGAYNH